MTTATLVSTHATTGRSCWFDGELWLLAGGVLLLPKRAAGAVAHGARPAAAPGERVEVPLTPAEAEAAAASHRRAVWVPREAVVAAALHSGASSERLRLELVDGNRVVLQWLSGNGAYEFARDALNSWLGVVSERGTPPSPVPAPAADPQAGGEPGPEHHARLGGQPGPECHARVRRFRVIAALAGASVVGLAVLASLLDHFPT